jgi:hypothetical protein
MGHYGYVVDPCAAGDTRSQKSLSNKTVDIAASQNVLRLQLYSTAWLHRAPIAVFRACTPVHLCGSA